MDGNTPPPQPPQENKKKFSNQSYNSYDPPRIISLNLSSSGLTGAVAPSISNLTKIETLDLSNNNLTGAMPEFLISYTYGFPEGSKLERKQVNRISSGTTPREVKEWSAINKIRIASQQLRQRSLVTAIHSTSQTSMTLSAVCSSTKTVGINGGGGQYHGTGQRTSRLTSPFQIRMAASSGGELSTAFEEGQLERPKWSGETPISRLVGALISFKPLFSVLKLGARRVFISTAEKKNIPWREMTNNILDSDVYKVMESIQNPSIVYPDYYLNPFHAYDEGNLSWLAAAEAEAATMSMVMRAIPDASSVDEANQIVRGNWLNAIDEHHQKYSEKFPIRDILDIGCSVGVSTRFLANKFPSAKLTGLDLSPYFLSVAEFKERKSGPRKNPISWLHANGENTGLPSQSFDIVSIAYVFHECPARAITNLVKEAFRLLRPGGTVALTDNSPKSKILQELSPVLFTLMKSTEPFLDEYYLLDLEKTVKEAGFVNVETRLTDPRHRTLTATVPK